MAGFTCGHGGLHPTQPFRKHAIKNESLKSLDQVIVFYPIFICLKTSANDGVTLIRTVMNNMCMHRALGKDKAKVKKLPPQGKQEISRLSPSNKYFLSLGGAAMIARHHATHYARNTMWRTLRPCPCGALPPGQATDGHLFCKNWNSM